MLKHRSFLFPLIEIWGKTPLEPALHGSDIVREMFFPHATHMKLNGILILIAPLAFAGCVQSHRAPVVYSTPPAYAPYPEAPPAVISVPETSVSSRPEVRVYPPAATEATPEPLLPAITYGPSEADLALAQSLRRILSADTSLASASRNMMMSIQNGRVTLTGTAPSENARRVVEQTVGSTAGVVSVEDRVQVDLH